MRLPWVMSVVLAFDNCKTKTDIKSRVKKVLPALLYLCCAGKGSISNILHNSMDMPYDIGRKQQTEVGLALCEQENGCKAWIGI